MPPRCGDGAGRASEGLRVGERSSAPQPHRWRILVALPAGRINRTRALRLGRRRPANRVGRRPDPWRLRPARSRVPSAPRRSPHGDFPSCIWHAEANPSTCSVWTGSAPLGPALDAPLEKTTQSQFLIGVGGGFGLGRRPGSSTLTALPTALVLVPATQILGKRECKRSNSWSTHYQKDHRAADEAGPTHRVPRSLAVLSSWTTTAPSTVGSEFPVGVRTPSKRARWQ